MQKVIDQLAGELLEAERTTVPVAPLTERFENLTVEDAYQIQLAIAKSKTVEGRKVIGKKVGLTSKAMQNMLGVTEPDYGHLFDDMAVKNGETVRIDSMIKPRVEAEIGFVLREELFQPNVTFLDVLMATDYVVPALEIIDSRIADWKIKLVDTVADNGSSAKVVLSDKKKTIDEVDFRSASMVLFKNEELIATGAGAAALGHPAHAVAWLANKLYEFGIPLKANELILPGALSAAIDVLPGDTVTAEFGPLGWVSVHFA
ncbi:2-keto-4-pentenoate hydratase [Fictibacillus sp. B-59209]|uniref:2-keto-4-pentenoate hydratase n=1 Tax=Fictibacillus sp. B-59209 TaxID=3024873 RepID=UPI002E1F2A11|nr:2-keto-4-pentenoate hydratase [Fictibacillus sp. B-59209]